MSTITLNDRVIRAIIKAGRAGSRPAQGLIMTRISTFSLVSGALAALALSVNGASAELPPAVPPF
jgi:hypothetical protein